ncbi:probable peptidyl-tRNA hydrolase 2 [Ruditapes philippinarum]|uniref:probable peptidyl-tRNA hydrolase 2 n=1 Tax=Ruditapes philippinarum TaxID=129788 RepID=UPI00295B91E4|nr:probable peptidyl-tRNA hydrolase 2 [Ruditapes philippinarum]XP_060587687.1 probable peptidyl-tRNA hydrolase 2 [Ruditapes philippinarum]XP_060587688.1 probable peptidyl-tRNA hydrolase 2 [Ruditapes philippinarum]
MDEASGAGSNSSFQPKEEIINTLLSLGFSRNSAIKGCYYTGNYSADLAAAWVIENQDKNLDGPLEDDLEFEDEDDSEEELPEGFDLHKMVFVVNMELNMGVGKVAAQCAHAALALHRIMIDNADKFGEMMMSWEQFGETKIVLKGDNSAQLLDLAKKAEGAGLPNYIVHDAGRTQIAAGSQTVLGIMGKIDTVDSITGKLKLL